MAVPSVLDTSSAPGFYRSPLGKAASVAIGQRLLRFWPDLGGLTVLGLGFPAPFLPLWQLQAYRCLNATSSQHDKPPPGSCSIDATRLPLPDLTFDRVLIIHGVEPASHDARLLREIWRVLKDDGRILVVAPNRLGMWAHFDHTPFGQGRPYSCSQIDRLLAAAMFRTERRDTALFIPPATFSPLLKLTACWERFGRFLTPQLAGVTITEAVKDAYAALPMAIPAQRRLRLSEAA